MDKRNGVLIFVYSKQENLISILLVKQRNGHWSFPSGGIEANEAPLEAAQRELREETGISGIELTPTPLINEFFYTKDAKGIQPVFLCYLQSPQQTAPEKNFQDEIKESKWVIESDLPLYLTRKGMLELLAKIKQFI